MTRDRSRAKAHCPSCWEPVLANQTECPACGFWNPADSWLPFSPRGIKLANGEYELVTPIGTSGFNCIAMAKQMASEVELGTVAIRFPWIPTAAGSTAQFFAEAATIRRAPHPNLIALHGAFVEQETPFLVLEHLGEAPSYSDFIRRQCESLADLIGVWTQICAAIDSFHQRSAFHGDVKPGNIAILQWDSGCGYFAKILDFGIASVWDRREEEPATGIGTIGFAAPEQLEGHPDPRSDVFSFGVLMYWSLTGTLPFPYKACKDPEALRDCPLPAPPDGFPQELGSLVLECLHPDPEQRFPRMPGNRLQEILDAQEQDEEDESASILANAKHLFLKAGFATDGQSKRELYTRSADLFQQASDLATLSSSDQEMSARARRYADRKTPQPSEGWIKKIFKR